MDKIILVDHSERDHLLPLTYTRPVAHVRIGILRISEKWEQRFGVKVDYWAVEYLRSVFPGDLAHHEFAVNGAVIPTEDVVNEIASMPNGSSLFSNGQWVASRGVDAFRDGVDGGQRIESGYEVRIVSRYWKIFQWNEWALKEDFTAITAGRTSQPIPAYVQLVGDQVFIEEGATVLPSIINASTGPVYIGRNAEVMEGSVIRGGLALCEGAQLKMGAKIYGPTTIGPHSRVGGEVNNCVIFGYSNKGHDGFIGNSVIGEWCNLGADTNTSNLKNTYADVKVYNYALKRSESTGGPFCGLCMGDHAKAGINTMFNTGTVCGIFANVFGAGFPHRHIPDFGWGGAEGFRPYRLNEALEVAERVMERRHVVLTEEWKAIFSSLHAELSGMA